MQKIRSKSGAVVSYDTWGEGPPLVLVHGSFSDHETNWSAARQLLAGRFSVRAIARRGRGETTATQGHTVDDEAADVIAVLETIGEPAVLLGHSYGALCALNAAALAPGLVARLVLYEPPRAGSVPAARAAELEPFAAAGDWNGMVEAFMRDPLQVPEEEIAAIKASDVWSDWIADAPATLGDLRAIVEHHFDASRLSALTMPVQLLIGSESPREVFYTDDIASSAPDTRIAVLQGQAHEGATTDPAQFVEAITAFSLSSLGTSRAA